MKYLFKWYVKLILFVGYIPAFIIFFLYDFSFLTWSRYRDSEISTNSQFIGMLFSLFVVAAIFLYFALT